MKNTFFHAVNQFSRLFSKTQAPLPSPPSYLESQHLRPAAASETQGPPPGYSESAAQLPISTSGSMLQRIQNRYDQSASGHSLNLEKLSLTDKHLPMIAQFLKQHPGINQLILNHNRIRHPAFLLACCAEAKYLIWEHNAITDEDMQAFAIELLSLEQQGRVQTAGLTLEFSHNKVGDAGAVALAALLPAPLSLDLTNNYIGDLGAEALTKDKRWFRMIFLGENLVSEEVADAIHVHNGAAYICCIYPKPQKRNLFCCSL